MQTVSILYVFHRYSVCHPTRVCGRLALQEMVTRMTAVQLEKGKLATQIYTLTKVRVCRVKQVLRVARSDICDGKTSSHAERGLLGRSNMICRDWHRTLHSLNLSLCKPYISLI